MHGVAKCSVITTTKVKHNEQNIRSTHKKLVCEYKIICASVFLGISIPAVKHKEVG